MQTLAIPEYRTSDEVLDLETARGLAEVSDGALSVVDPTASGARLQAAQHVGVVAWGDVEVRITPKAPMANVLAMLGAAAGLRHRGVGVAGHRDQNDLLRSFVAMFAEVVGELLARGPQRAYVARQERLVAPRGRLVMVELNRRGNVPSPIDCAFDELSVDTPLNRYLLAAIERCLRVPGMPAPAVRRLRHARALLDGVARRSVRVDALDGHTFTRLDERYRPSIGLARLVLSRLSLHLDAGRHRVPTFTVDMNRLFEAWVTARLPDHLPNRLRLRAQTHRHLDRERTLRIQPDLELSRGGKIVGVADTKYKLAPSGVGRVGDYYQAHAYATVLGLRRATLIYCEDAGQAPSRRLHVAGSDVAVLTHAIDVGGAPVDLEAAINGLAGVLADEALQHGGRQPVAELAG